MTKNTPLDPSLKLRATTQADVNTVADLIYAVCEADGDVTIATTAEELEHLWQEEGFDLQKDSLVVETPNGQIVGYIELFNEKAFAHLNADWYVHPTYKKHGVGEALFANMEKRANEMMQLAEPDLRVFLHVSTDSKDSMGQALFREFGYELVRHFWRMEISLESAPPAPEFPAGIELRPFDVDAHARLIWQAHNEAFGEHWGSHDRSWEEWSFQKLEQPEFDPSLWLVAWDGDQIAGFSQNRFRMGIGWVGSLGVLKPWRKHGLGLALLKRSFADFYKRGAKTIGLGVDASNSTGATRLYERAGMHVASEFVTFEKELRPGRSLEEE